MKNDRSFWSTHVAAIKTAGISTSAYSRQHQLSLASLYYWQRKLQLQAPRRPLAIASPTSKPHSKFVALRLSGVAPYSAAAPCACTLVLTGGARLEMSALPEPQWLVAVDRANQVGH